MMKRLMAMAALALTASLSQALIMNWTVLNDARYCDSYTSVQLVAVNESAGADKPDTLYSYYIALEDGGLREAKKGAQSYSALNLDTYMTVLGNDGELSNEPVGNNFNFTGYSFYFRMLDANGVEMGRTTGPCGSPYEGPLGWDNVYEQYVLDAGHLTPTVWVVGVPEPCSAALMLLGVSALLLRRRAA